MAPSPFVVVALVRLASANTDEQCMLQLPKMNSNIAAATRDNAPLVTLHWNGGSVDVTEEVTCLAGRTQITADLGVPNDQLSGISNLRSDCEVTLFEHSRHCRSTADAADNCDSQLCMTLNADTTSLGGMSGKASGVTVQCTHTLWSQHLPDAGRVKCNNNVDMEYVADQAACQSLALQNGHAFYSFRHNGEEPGHKCMSSATCDSPLTNRHNDWAIYTQFETQCLGTFQAEDATLGGNARVHANTASANHQGFTGSSFVDYISPSDDFVEWTLSGCSGGDATASFRYALASGNRPLQVLVNNEEVAASLSFPASGAWNQWAEASLAVPLSPGTNVVRLVATGVSGANMDSLSIAGLRRSGTTTDGCTTSNTEDGEFPTTQLTDPDAVAALRCCGDDGTCQTQDLPGSESGPIFNPGNGQQHSEDQACYNEVTFEQAEAICHEAGRRLCSVAELNDGVCCGTGCWHDRRAIWASN